MPVLEFIVQMTSALAWPLVVGGAVILLRKQIRTAADKLVERIGEIAHLQFLVAQSISRVRSNTSPQQRPRKQRN